MLDISVWLLHIKGSFSIILRPDLLRKIRIVGWRSRATLLAGMVGEIIMFCSQNNMFSFKCRDIYESVDL